MSMLDSFFTKGGFKGAKCKTLLKLTIPRIKLLRNRREIQLKQMRKDIAKLLENGQEATARIRVEHIVREENMMAAQEILELFCELIVVRLPIIETQRECPLDLKEAISSICFAALRCADLPELMQIQMLFAAKYGKEFIIAATELMPDCGVNRQIIELLSVRAPSVETKMKLLREIAEEHELDWDPTSTETEFLKPHEDLLNGPNNYNSSSNLPPKEKQTEESASNTVESDEKSLDLEETESDAGFDSLDLPEVPKVSVQPVSTIPSAPGLGPHTSVQSTNITNTTTDSVNLPSIPFPNAPPLNVSFTSPETKQFVPFISPPNQSVEPNPIPQQFPTNSSIKVREIEEELQKKQKERILSPQSVRVSENTNLDLQDVLAAAQSAAETAERAATAARVAANLAQIRISDLVVKNNTKNSTTGSLPEKFDERVKNENPRFDRQDSNLNPFSKEVTEVEMELKSNELKEEVEMELKSNELKEAHTPQRLPSLEDDPYDTYPNLFSSQGANSKNP